MTTPNQPAHPELQALHAKSRAASAAYFATPLGKAEERYWKKMERVEKLEAELAAARAEMEKLRDARDACAESHPEDLALKTEWFAACEVYRQGLNAASTKEAA